MLNLMSACTVMMEKVILKLARGEKRFLLEKLLVQEALYMQSLQVKQLLRFPS